MSRFDWKKRIEESVTDGWITTAIITGIFFALRTVNKKPPKASLDSMDIMKHARGIHRGGSLQEMDQ